MNGIDEYLDGIQAKQRQQAALDRSMAAAATVAPDIAARQQWLAKQTGVPAAVVPLVKDQLEQSVRDNALRAQDLPANAPRTADWLAKPDNMAVAHDDVGVLTAIERAIKYVVSAPGTSRGLAGDVAKGGAALASSVPKANEGLWGAAQASAEVLSEYLTGPAARARILPEDIGARMAAGFSSMRTTSKGIADKTMPKADGIVESSVYSGLQSMGLNVALFPLAVVAPEVALSIMSTQTGGQAYGQAREKGVAPLPALGFASSQAVIEYATEKIPMARLIGDVKAGTPFLKTLAKNLALEMPGEQVATALQDLNEWAVLHPDKPFSDYLAERPSAAIQTAIATAVGSGGQVGTIALAQKVAERWNGKAQQADEVGKLLDEIQAQAAASKLRERAPDTFGDFVAAAAADGPVTDVYINAQVLQQSGLAEHLMQASPAAAEQMATALATGTDIRIPVDEYAGRVAGQDFAQPLMDHLRTEADGMSRAEAKEFMQTQGEELQRTVEKALAEHQSDQAFKADADKVRTEVERQLNEVGRFTPDVNASYAALMGAFYATQAARLGITPSEMLQRFPVRIAAQGMGPLEQGSVQTDTPQFKAWFGGSKVVDGEGKPLVVYHGSADEFTTFDKSRLGSNTGYGDALAGFHFAESRADADFYATMSAQKRGVQDGGVIRPFFLAIKNPLVVGVDETSGNAKERTQEFLDDKIAAREFAIDNGYDGIIYPHGTNVDSGYTAIAFEPEQIKSAIGNNGKFDPNNPSILEQDARGTYNPATSTIALLKGADLSTFLHETGHFYLDTLFAMAEQVRNQQAPAEGGIDIVKDADALLKWFGVSDLATWYTMSLDEQRPYHEQFARGFERYLFEGNSPSIEMQSLFQRFAAWMLNVYRNLKALNVELNSEVRSVMDRMLASREQIRETEMAGSMMPLFNSAEAAGMDPVAWRAYQALANDATQTAMGELETRSLRDMQWLANAHSRAIKELQKQAAERRRSVRMEARAEVMAKPVYRAWQFLTGKIEAGDRLGGNKRASDPNVVDETQDSLFVAIAKLGGLDRGQVESQWGFDPKQKAPQPVFGKPLLRRDGGLTLDAMAEKLAELGYIQRDENGKHDLTELEDKFDEESRGRPQHSFAADYGAMAEGRAGEQYNIGGLSAGRLDRGTLRLMDLPGAAVERLTKLRMVAKEGIDPDILATLFGFSSGDEMVQALAAANTPSSEVEGRTDQLMLERYGDLVDEKAIERAANKAVHNLNRSRVIETELSALDKANRVRSPNGKTDKNGRPQSFAVLPKAAKQFAANMIAKLQVRNLKPTHYTAAEVRAAKAAEKALRSGDLTAAASEKRNQLIQHYAARAALDAVAEMEKGVAYLKRIEASKTIDVDYLDQIHQLLEKFDLRPASLKAIDGRKSLADWIESQRDMGLEPQIPQDVLDAAGRTHFKDLTVEQIRGLVDTVRQIEHLGRLKHRLLTARDQRDLERAVGELVASIEENGPDKVVDLRTRTTWPATVKSMGRQFLAIHRKMASYARQMDGAKDGGAVWEYFIRTMNDHADMEAQMRADATARLHELVAPLFEGERMHHARFFPAVQMSLTREERLGIALNTGNAGNKQRLLDGEGWTQAQLDSILATLTAADWTAVQNIWDYFESYRPQIAAKERRVYGKEPDWVEPVPFDVEVDGKTMSMRGGYYPVKYDPARNAKAGQHAEAEEARQMIKGAYTSATTRRSFTKARAEEVVGRPLLYGLQGLYQGTTEVIHDLSWHEWLIDVNRLLRNKAVDMSIRTRYGAEAVDVFKNAIKDIAAGDAPAQHVGERILNHIRTGATVAGLGWNLTTSLLQPLGLTQSMVRIGPAWVARGMGQWFKAPFSTSERINEMSTFMSLRAQTQQREINEIRNKVSGQSDVRQAIEQSFFMMIAKMQQVADIPTWLGQYEKSIAAGETEPRAIALADQAVRDSQGGGQIGDLSQIQRGGPAFKLFTNFYSFFNVAYNQGAESWNRTDFKKPGDVMRLATDFLLLYSVPAALATLLKSALVGDADDPEKLMRKLIAEQISYLFGLMVGVRELSAGVATMLGVQQFDATYSGPAGLRLFSEATKLAKQIQQGEWDTAMRKALVNTSGILFHLPSGQVNRTWDGVQALSDGTTQNPLAPLVGAPPKN